MEVYNLKVHAGQEIDAILAYHLQYTSRFLSEEMYKMCKPNWQGCQESLPFYWAATMLLSLPAHLQGTVFCQYII